MHSILAARAVIGSGALALIALAALHILKPDLDPSRTMISQYALGPYGWIMALCFAAFAAGSACLLAALIADVPSLIGRIGLVFLLAASVGLAMAAVYPMDPVSTVPEQMSFTGRMHGVSFMIGVPGMVLAVLLLGPGKPPNPNRPERFLGWPNRMLMVAYAVWLMRAAWPMARDGS